MNSNTKSYYYNESFINVLNEELRNNNITELLINGQKYSVEYIFTQITRISTIRYSSYNLPNKLKEFMGLIYAPNKTLLKTTIKRQTISEYDDDKFIHKYVVVGNDIPLNIKSLDVICD